MRNKPAIIIITPPKFCEATRKTINIARLRNASVSKGTLKASRRVIKRSHYTPKAGNIICTANRPQFINYKGIEYNRSPINARYCFLFASVFNGCSIQIRRSGLCRTICECRIHLYRSTAAHKSANVVGDIFLPITSAHESFMSPFFNCKPSPSKTIVPPINGTKLEDPSRRETSLESTSSSWKLLEKLAPIQYDRHSHC